MKPTIHNFLEFFREKGHLKPIRKAALSVREKYLYPNKLKNRNFDNADGRRFESEKTTPLLHVGGVFSDSKMLPSAKSKTDSSSCLGICQNAPSRMLEGRAEHLAYTLYRMPATYAAVKRALEHVKEALPEFSPKSVLDLGTGPGTALLAVRETFPGMEKALGLERNKEFIELFQECFSFFHETRVEAKLFSLEEPFPDTPFDLVIASYSFNELEEEVIQKWVQWARKNAKVFVVVEPGTPAGFEKILTLREACQGGLFLAPCPHAFRCPIKAEGRAWCHETIRLSRSFIHRYMKEGTLSYEDEKFCYLGVLFDTSLACSVPSCRIVNTPRHRSGHTYLSLCSKDGALSECIISRKRKELYALAKRARWGDSFPDPYKP